jgi:Protein of unknown function (DUF2510)
VPSPQPAWYADPQDGSRIRWWDGVAWTHHVTAHPAATAPAREPAMAMASAAPAYAVDTVADLGGAPSVGAARLPPLPPPPSAVKVEAEGRASGGVGSSNPTRSLLRAVIVVAVLVAMAVGVYASGVVDTLIGGGGSSAREPSSAAVNVYNGDRYSFEVPITWSRWQDTGVSLLPEVGPPHRKFEFESPEGEQLMILTSPVTRGAGPTTLQADAATKVALGDGADGASVQLQGPTAVDIAGMSAQQYDLSQVQSGELTFAGSVTVFVTGHRMVIVAMEGTPAQFDSPVAVLERQLLLESFRLD